MQHDGDSLEQPLLTRRAFVGALVIVGGTPACLAFTGPTAEPEMSAPPGATPVVSFHHDLPYLDHTGSAEPYLPPHGLRSAQAMGELDEAAFRSRYGYA